jgi:hypothetical protein
MRISATIADTDLRSKLSHRGFSPVSRQHRKPETVKTVSSPGQRGLRRAEAAA